MSKLHRLLLKECHILLYKISDKLKGIDNEDLTHAEKQIVDLLDEAGYITGGTNDETSDQTKS